MKRTMRNRPRLFHPFDSRSFKNCMRFSRIDILLIQFRSTDLATIARRVAENDNVEVGTGRRGRRGGWRLAHGCCVYLFSLYVNEPAWLEHSNFPEVEFWSWNRDVAVQLSFVVSSTLTARLDKLGQGCDILPGVLSSELLITTYLSPSMNPQKSGQNKCNHYAYRFTRSFPISIRIFLPSFWVYIDNYQDHVVLNQLNCNTPSVRNMQGWQCSTTSLAKLHHITLRRAKCFCISRQSFRLVVNSGEAILFKAISRGTVKSSQCGSREKSPQVPIPSPVYLTSALFLITEGRH